MSDSQHLERILQRPVAWNRWRNENQGLKPDLSGADLGGANLVRTNLFQANLSGANLVRANLTEADLTGANLILANLFQANLSGADLTGSNLGSANFTGANLTGANLFKVHLSGAELIGTNLTGADLSGSNVRGAVLQETVFGDTKLSEVLELDSCTHWGPSILDHRTLAKSGQLPLSFLRGCGLPDRLIDYLPSLLNQAIQFYSCFISYSTEDQPFAERLHADLQNRGVRCWFAPHDIQGGKKIHEQIDKAIQMHDRLLLLLSEASMNSEWVKTEIAKARKREIREQRRMLFPVRLVAFETLRNWECFDADTGKDSAREVREYYVSDFSNWKEHDSYQKTFERLLRDLKAEAQAQANADA